MTKTRVSDLAIFGGAPAFSDKLYVGRPNIGNRERLLQRINRMLDDRWLSNAGQYVQEFERRVAELVGVRHCIAMCNATIALEIAIRATGMKGEVIVPSFTFVATAHALQWQEISPVFADIDPRTHLLDPEKLEQLITPRTTGIIPVHLWGQPCNVEAIDRVARNHGLKVIYDSAHAFACSHDGRMIGTFGDAEVFSFHATKFFNTFEGGAVVTNDDELARRIRLMKNFGFTGYDQVEFLGINGKMTEASAAMGLTSLESLADFVDVNRRNYKQYQEELAELWGVRMLTYDETEQNNYQYIVLEVDEKAAGISRDHLVRVLSAENIMARRYFYPGCHRMEPYRSMERYQKISLPNTEGVASRVMSLPNGTAVGENEIRRTCEVIRFVLENGSEVTAGLHTQATEPAPASE